MMDARIESITGERERLVIPEQLQDINDSGSNTLISAIVGMAFNTMSNPHCITRRQITPNELVVFAPGIIIPDGNKDDTIVINMDNISAYDRGDLASCFDFGPLYIDKAMASEDYIDIVARCSDQRLKRPRSGIHDITNDSTPTHFPSNDLEFVDGAIIGRFFMTSQSLVVSDLWHSPSALAKLDMIVNELYSNGYLTYVKNHGKKPSLSNKKKIVVTVGCDPEYELIDRNGKVTDHFPSEIFPGRHRADDGGGEEIGVDGGGNVLEFRPQYQKSASKLIEEMKKLMTKMKNQHISTIGSVFSTGCHLHFGVGKCCYPPSGLVTMLDEFLGGPCYHMNGRARGSYKDLGQYREQPWGFEYRSLPATITSDAEFFRIVLKIGLLIVDKYANGKPMKYEFCKVRNDYMDVVMPTYDSYKHICGLTRAEHEYFCEYLLTWKSVCSYEQNVIALWEIPDAIQRDYSNYDKLTPEYYEGSEDDDDYDGDSDRAPARRESSVPYIMSLNIPPDPSTIQEDMAVRECRVNIAFREQWDDLVRQETFDQVVASLDMAELGRIGYRSDGAPFFNDITIELIGLRNDRGYVVGGFDPPLAEGDNEYSAQHVRIDDTTAVHIDAFGMSYAYRTGDLYVLSPTYYIKLVTAIGNAVYNRICAKINERIEYMRVLAERDTISDGSMIIPTLARPARMPSIARQWHAEYRQAMDDAPPSIRAFGDRIPVRSVSINPEASEVLRDNVARSFRDLYHIEDVADSEWYSGAANSLTFAVDSSDDWDDSNNSNTR